MKICKILGVVVLLLTLVGCGQEKESDQRKQCRSLMSDYGLDDRSDYDKLLDDCEAGKGLPH